MSERYVPPAPPAIRESYIGKRWIGDGDACDLCLMDTVHAPGCPREMAAEMLRDDPSLAFPEPDEPPTFTATLRGLLGDALVRFGERLRRVDRDAL